MSTTATRTKMATVTAPPFLGLPSPGRLGPGRSRPLTTPAAADPLLFTTWTGAPAGSGPLTDSAVQVSLLTRARPMGDSGLRVYAIGTERQLGAYRGG